MVKKQIKPKTSKTKKVVVKKTKTVKKSMVRIPIKKDNMLEKIGYKNVKDMTKKEREEKLMKGINKIHKTDKKSEGSVMRDMIRKLNVLSIYHKNENPKIAKMFKDDQKFLSKMYKEKKEHKLKIKENVKMMKEKLHSIKKNPEVKNHIKEVKEKINEYKNSVSNTNKQKIKKDMMKIKHDIEKIMKKSKK
jgi:hypothetical protein